jgi:hypothetical protein
MEKCFECKTPKALICWVNSKRIVLCKACLAGKIENEELANILIISDSSKPNWNELNSLKSLEQLHTFIEKRLKRLLYQKEKYLLDLQIAGEELKRLIDKEITNLSEKFLIDSEKSEINLRSLLSSFSMESTQKLRILNKSLVSPDPIEFDLTTDAILSSLSCLGRYRFNNLEESSSLLPFYFNNELKVFIPGENRTKTLTRAKLRLLPNSSFCFVPNNWVFIAGGRNNSSTLNFCQKIRTNRSKVFNLQPLNESRHSFAMIYAKGFVYAFGGKNDENFLSSCEKFCFRTQEWISINSMNHPRFQISLAVAEDFIVLTGLGSSTIEKFCLLTETFESIQVTKGLDEVVRVTLDVDEKIILFGKEKVSFLNGFQEECAFEQGDFEPQGGGPCVQFEEWNYLEMNGEIWKVNRISNKVLKHLEG